MRDYCLEIGNSTDGPIGLVAHCQATSKSNALDILFEELGDTVEIRTGTYYQNVYLNWDKITIKDVTLSD